VSFSDYLWIGAGAFAGGFANGLSGFGMAMAAIVFWLQAVSPATASSLAAICAVVAHAQSVGMIVKHIDVRRLAPFIVAGLLGIPVGTWLLVRIDEPTFRLGVGAVMVVYCLVMLSGRFRLKADPGRVVDTGIFFAGGILGGLAGLSGALPAMWAGLRGWAKNERRAIFQPFNMAVLAVTVVAHLAAGLLSEELLRSLLVAIPLTLVGAHLGKALYRRLHDHHFDRAVLAILLIGGLLTLGSTFLPHR
jgi:uncharacterized membrane protein YfcA